MKRLRALKRIKMDGSQGFTLLELIVALSLSVFVLIGVIQAATSVIAVQLDTHRRSTAEGFSLNAALSLAHDLRDATYLQCPPAAGASNAACNPTTGPTGNVLSGCTNWSMSRNGPAPGGAAVLSNNTYPTTDECSGNMVKSFYYCTPSPSYSPGADVRLMRYVACGATCSIPAPGSCGTATGGATMTTVVPAYPGFYYMDNNSGSGLGYYYQRSDDASGASMHFIVGIGTRTTQGVSQGGMNRNAPIAVSYKYNMKVNMNKSYNTTGD